MLSFEQVLARLLSEPMLRRAFVADREACLAALGADAGLSAQFVSLHAGELERQAKALVDKRLLEVRQLLPLTMARLGDAAGRLFEGHAAIYWPEGTERHRHDAVRFARWARDHGYPVDTREVNRLLFLAGHRPLCVRAVRCSVRSGAVRPVVQVLFRWRAQAREWLFYLG